MEHVNLQGKPGGTRERDWATPGAQKYPGPLVVIDGEPKFAGSIQVKKIVKEVGNIWDKKKEAVVSEFWKPCRKFLFQGEGRLSL